MINRNEHNIKQFDSLQHLHSVYAPEFGWHKHYNTFFSYDWNSEEVSELLAINPARAMSRIAAYVDFEELDRAGERAARGKDFSIRMGVEKKGRGHHGERGDFCMVGLCYSNPELTVFYRSVDLIGGLIYDQAILALVIDWMDLNVRNVNVFAALTHIMALQGNSNQKLHGRMKEVYARLSGNLVGAGDDMVGDDSPPLFRVRRKSNFPNHQG